MIIKGKDGHVEFCVHGLNICVRDRPHFTVFRMEIEQNSCVIVKFNAIFAVLTIYVN